METNRIGFSSSFVISLDFFFSASLKILILDGSSDDAFDDESSDIESSDDESSRSKPSSSSHMYSMKGHSSAICLKRLNLIGKVDASNDLSKGHSGMLWSCESTVYSCRSVIEGGMQWSEVDEKWQLFASKT